MACNVAFYFATKYWPLQYMYAHFEVKFNSIRILDETVTTHMHVLTWKTHLTQSAKYVLTAITADVLQGMQLR